MMQITLPQRQIPVKETVQVLVVGGGPAGVAAAFALRDQTAPAGVPVSELQALLRQGGFSLLQ